MTALNICLQNNEWLYAAYIFLATTLWCSSNQLNERRKSKWEGRELTMQTTLSDDRRLQQYSGMRSVSATVRRQSILNRPLRGQKNVQPPSGQLF
jgi:hypothetical protein